MNTVHFVTPGEIDLNVVRIAGVSVKENDNPIGRFGTGLKYAIAVLLRTGHSIQIKTGGETYTPVAGRLNIRGKDFNRVCLNGPNGLEELGYTTDLGRDWHVWMAYRELHSNTLDENGIITDGEPDEYMTTISVTGTPIKQAYDNRRQIFIPEHETPIWSTDSFEIYEGSSKYLFYRGVRVLRLSAPTIFTYNLKQNLQLTEDRTVSSEWDAQYELAVNIGYCTNIDILRNIVKAKKGVNYEHNLSYFGSPSEALKQAAREVFRNDDVSDAIKNIGRDSLSFEEKFNIIKEVPETTKLVFERAYKITDQISPDIREMEIHVAESLDSVLGLFIASNEQVLISMEAVNMGATILAGTLYEEWLHKSYGVKDYTRKFQDLVINQLITVAERNI